MYFGRKEQELHGLTIDDKLAKRTSQNQFNVYK